jgi:hypothetical protein
VDKAQREFILGLIGGGTEGYQSLHRQPDDRDYLEIAEQKALEKEIRALALIESFCRRHGVTQSGELLQQQRAIFAALSKALIEDAGLSLRKTASFLGTTHQRVQEVMRVERK